MTNYPQDDFQRGVVQPIECLKGGWNLVKDQYFLFVGVCAVGMLIGGAVPLGILMGPMMCGIFLTLFSKRRGMPVDFNLLFKGFDYFGQSVIAALLHTIPVMAVIFLAVILMYVGMFAAIFAAVAAGQDSALFALIGFGLLFLLFYCVIMFVVIVITIGFTFAYPLIVDRNLQGFDAVKLSFRAALSNFWRLLGLNLLGGLLSVLGVSVCYVGIFFIFPITLGATAIAYEQVFGLKNSSGIPSNLPPPPPAF